MQLRIKACQNGPARLQGATQPSGECDRHTGRQYRGPMRGYKHTFKHELADPIRLAHIKLLVFDSQVLIVLEHLHSLDVAYRHLKSENILIQGRFSLRVQFIGFCLANDQPDLMLRAPPKGTRLAWMDTIDFVYSLKQ